MSGKQITSFGVFYGLKHFRHFLLWSNWAIASRLKFWYDHVYPTIERFNDWLYWHYIQPNPNWWLQK